MATAKDICRGALKRITILGVGEEMTAADATDVLEALNGVMHGWKAQGLNYEHTTMDLDTTFPLGDEFHDGMKAMLGVRVAPEYGGAAVVSPLTHREAEDAWRLIAAKYWTANKADVDETLKRMPSQNLYNFTAETTS